MASGIQVRQLAEKTYQSSQIEFDDSYPVDLRPSGIMAAIDLPPTEWGGKSFVLVRGLMEGRAPGDPILLGERVKEKIVNLVPVASTIDPRFTITEHPGLISDGLAVKGLEDPTYISEADNPFEPGKRGFLCTQIYSSAKYPDRADWVDACTIYVSLDSDTPPRLVLHDSLVEEGGLSTTCNMAKEPELITIGGKRALVFEYSDYDGKQTSNMAICEVLTDGSVGPALPFLTAREAGADHVSPLGNPKQLPDGRVVFFYNRGFGPEGYGGPDHLEWGVTASVITDQFPPSIEQADLPWMIPPPFAHPAAGVRDVGGHVIAFASSVDNVGSGLRINYHVDDLVTVAATFSVEPIEVGLGEPSLVVLDPHLSYVKAEETVFRAGVLPSQALAGPGVSRAATPGDGSIGRTAGR